MYKDDQVIRSLQLPGVKSHQEEVSGDGPGKGGGNHMLEELWARPIVKAFY